MLIVRQSTGKLDLMWPPPQADEEQRQLSEVEDFVFESLLKGTICVLNFFPGLDSVTVTLVLVTLWLKFWAGAGNPKV